MWRSRVAYPTSVIWGGRSARPTTRSCVTSIITTWSSHWRVCCASPQSLAVHAQWRIAPRLCARCALSLRRKRRFVAPRKLWSWLQCSLRLQVRLQNGLFFPNRIQAPLHKRKCGLHSPMHQAREEAPRHRWTPSALAPRTAAATTAASAWRSLTLICCHALTPEAALQPSPGPVGGRAQNALSN